VDNGPGQSLGSQVIKLGFHHPGKKERKSKKRTGNRKKKIPKLKDTNRHPSPPHAPDPIKLLLSLAGLVAHGDTEK